MMLATTITVVGVFVANDKAKAFLVSETGMIAWYACTVVSIAIMCLLICKHQYAKIVPVNYIALSVFTITHSYMVAGITTLYEPEIVVSAAVCTGAMFLGLTTYACFTKTDMTKKGGALVTATMMIFMFCLLSFLFDFGMLRVVIVVAVIILMSVWVVHDTQMIIGGKKKYQLSLDDYIVGALIIYIDVMTIFMYVLELFGGK